MINDLEGCERRPTASDARLVSKVAVVDVNVLPMDTDRIMAHQTVVVSDGFISAQGPASQVPVAGATVVPGQGKFLMPGLADLHVHLWEPSDCGMYLANGVTAVRNMRGSPFHLALQASLERREVPGPILYTTSPLVDGVDGEGRTRRPESIVLSDAARAEPLVRRLAARGYQQVKAYDRLSPVAFRALGKACAEHGLRLTGHCPDALSYEQAIDAGMSCFEHLTGISSGASRGSRDLRRLADLSARGDIWNCPTLVVGLAAGQGADSRCRSYLPRALTARWAWILEQRGQAGSLDEQRVRWCHEVDRLIEVVAALHDASAPLLVGTDARNPNVVPGFSFHDELDALASAGISSYALLRSATAESARFLGASELWGTIETGKRANVLVLDADPRTDLSTLRDPHAVLVNGFFLPRRELRRMLDERDRWVRNVDAQADAEPAPMRVEGGARGQRSDWLTERSYGTASASLVYHHREARSTHVVEERRVRPLSGTALEARLVFSTELVLERATWTTTSDLGAERVSATRLGADHYEVLTTALDGSVATTLVETPELLPDEQLCATFVALAAALGRAEAFLDRPLSGVTILNGEVQLVPMALRRVPSGPNGRAEWTLRVERPGAPVEWSYRFGRHNRLEGIRELSPPAVATWIRPASSGTQDAAPAPTTSA